MIDEKLKCDLDLNTYFDPKNYRLLNIGDVLLDTGAIIACDPLCSLDPDDYGYPPFIQRVPTGKYPVILSIYESKKYGYYNMAAKLAFSDDIPVRFELAICESDDLSDFKEGDIIGIAVDVGLACFCDIHTEKLYKRFIRNWMKKNPDKNYIDEYFLKCIKDDPGMYGEYGDSINFYLPNKKNNIIMFSSGMGDGLYPCYWGYDENDNICCLIIKFIDPAYFESK
jgi:hypothetical protein